MLFVLKGSYSNHADAERFFMVFLNLSSDGQVSHKLFFFTFLILFTGYCNVTNTSTHPINTHTTNEYIVCASDKC